MFKWLHFSGACVTITVNPLQWAIKPWANRFQDEWSGPNQRTVSFGWLFLTVRAWRDNGIW